MPRYARVPLILALTSLALAAPHASLAQAGGPAWYSLDGRAPGTPAQITIDAAQSDASHTVGTLTLSGFWITPKVAPDGTPYNDIQVPGLPNMNQTGAPHLPQARFDVGVVTGATNVTLRAAPSAPVFIHGLHLWPEPVEAQYHDGSPEVFTRNDAIYTANAFWPPDTSSFPVDESGKMGLLPYATPEINPFHFNPPQDDTEVHASYSFTLSHGGTAQTPITVPKPMLKALGESVINWNQVDPTIIRDPVHYVGYFLFICKSSDVPTLQPLIDQKKARGFFVSLLDADVVGPSCNGIFLAIRSWYLSTPKNSDHYCLLAGNYAELGQCLSPTISGASNGVLSDDSFGAPLAGQSLDKQVLVGRLPYDSPYELQYEVQHILEYEDKPPASPHYENVILAAHQGLIGSTPIYTWQEDVRTAGYAVAPNFITQYGVNPGVTDASLNANVVNGAGILCYLGHGNSYVWGGWDLPNENYDGISVLQCGNYPRYPIVWSFACETADISSGACLGEDWMHDGINGAVAFYGGTANVWVGPTNDLDAFMFDEVYNKSNIIQGYSIMAGEQRMEAAHQSGDAWKFLLLGDPQMSIRRYSPAPWYALAPQIETTVCDLGTCSGFKLTVRSATGAPVVDAQVSVDLVPAASPGRASRGAATQAVQASEIIDNRYTNASGTAEVPLPGLSDGTLYYTVQADDGSATLDSAQVVDGTLSAPGDPIAGPVRLTAWPTLARSLTRLDFGRAVDRDGEVRIFDAMGRRVATLPVRAGESAALWNIGASAERARPGVYLAALVTNRTLAKCRVVVIR